MKGLIALANEAETEIDGNDVLVTLSQINKGKVVTEANAKLTQLIDGVLRYGKAGKLTITLSVAPAKDETGLDVEAAIDVKAPQPKHPSYFFVGSGNKLTRDDPSMVPMFGRDEAGDRTDG